MSAHRAQSAPPRGKRPSLEDVLAAGLARLSLQPSNVGTRGPRGQPHMGLQRPSNPCNNGLIKSMDKEPEGPTTPRRMEVLEGLDATGELQKLYDEDAEQQDWEKWLRDDLNRNGASDARILPTHHEMAAAQQDRRAELKKRWAQQKNPLLPQSSDPRVTRNQGNRHIEEAAQIVMLDWFEARMRADENAWVSKEKMEAWKSELNLTKAQIRNYMAKLRRRSREEELKKLRAQKTPAPAPPPAEAEVADPSSSPLLLAPYENDDWTLE